MEKVYFQIGTNNGDDLFKIKCLKDNPSHIILVEPNPLHEENIKNSYKDFPNVYIYINAIYYKDNESLELVIPALNGKFGSPGENSIIYNHSHLSLIPMNTWGSKENMFKVNATSITFDTICDNLKISSIDYLQIDTEGFDYEIIKMINLDKYDIKQIRYEKWTFDSNDFTKHFGNDNEFGYKGMYIIKQKLEKYNYQLQDIHDESGKDILATKIIK